MSGYEDRATVQFHKLQEREGEDYQEGALEAFLRQISKGSLRSLRKKNSIKRLSSVESAGSLNEKEVAKRQKQHFENHQHRLEAMTEELSEMVEKPVGEIDRNGIINKTKTMEM